MGAATFTFSTGITVRVRRVSPFLVAELRKAHPPPEPPLQEVDYGDGQKRQEPNAAHPDYLKALAEYENHIRELQTDYIVKHGVDLDGDWQPQIAALREEWRREQGTELSETDDVLAYIQFVCVGANDDYIKLVNAIMGLSQPTEDAIAAEAASFRGEVSEG